MNSTVFCRLFPLLNIRQFLIFRTCFNTIEWSKFTFSRIQSMSSRYVRVTCLKFGLHPLRKDSWVEWELLWMLMITWSIDSKTQVSKCEWEVWIVRTDDAQELPCLTYWITFPTHIFTIELLLKRLSVYLHQAKKSHTPHYYEKLRFHTSERWFGVSKPFCKWSILERSKFTTFHIISHMTELLAILEFIDIIINLCNILSQLLLHFVTDLAGVFAVHSKSGRAILVKWAQKAQSCFHDWEGEHQWIAGQFLPSCVLSERWVELIHWFWRVTWKLCRWERTHAPFFRTVTVTNSVIFVTGVLKSLAVNARMIVFCPLCIVMRKEEWGSVGSTAVWTDVETETDGEDTWSVLHEESWGWRWDRYQKYVLSLDDGLKMQDTRVIFLEILKYARTTRRCFVPHIMTPSLLGTQILEEIMTFLQERDSERMEDQKVDLPVQQKIFEELMNVSQESLSKRRGEQFEVESVSQVMKEIFEVARVFPQEDRLQYTEEENEMQPLIIEEIFDTMKVTPQAQMSARICEQIMEVSVSQDTEQLIEVVKIESYRELWKRSLMLSVHHRLRNLRSRQRSGR